MYAGKEFVDRGLGAKFMKEQVYNASFSLTLETLTSKIAQASHRVWKKLAKHIFDENNFLPNMQVILKNSSWPMKVDKPK